MTTSTLTERRREITTTSAPAESLGLFTSLFDAERAQKRHYAAEYGIAVEGERVLVSGKLVATCCTDWDAINVAYGLALAKAVGL